MKPNRICSASAKLYVRSFLPDVLAAGGGAYFDVLNFHVYPAFAPNWVASPDDALWTEE